MPERFYRASRQEMVVASWSPLSPFGDDRDHLGDGAPLEAVYAVNTGRRLIATVTDLMYKNPSMNEEPVVRLSERQEKIIDGLGGSKLKGGWRVIWSWSYPVMLAGWHYVH